MKKIEIPLLNLLMALVKRWWLILLCACVGAGFFYVKTDKADKAGEAAYQAEAAGYEASLAAHAQKVEAQKGYVGYLNKLRDIHINISEQADNRVAKSLLMGLDPMNVQVAYLYAEAQGDDASKAIDLAVLNASTLSLHEALGDAYPEGVEEWVLRELLEVKREGNLLRVAFFIPQNEAVKADQIVDKVFAALKQQQTGETSAWGQLSIVRKGIGPVDGTYLNSFKEEVLTDARTARDRKNDLLGWAGNAQNDLKKLEDATPAQPVLPAPQAKKRAMFGAVLGAVLGAFFAVALYFIFLPLQEKRQLRRLLDIPFFGSLSEKDGYPLCLANVETASEGKKSILLTGSRIGREEAEKIAEKLNGMQDHIRFAAGDNVEKSADTVRTLAAADGVVLLEKVNASNLRAVYSQMERLGQSDAPVLGYFVY